MQEYVQAEFRRALDALRAAFMPLEGGLFADAASRAYYAVLQAAKAALAARGNHGGKSRCRPTTLRLNFG